MSDVLLINTRTERQDSGPAEGADIALLGRIARRISSAAPVDRVAAELVEEVDSFVPCDSCSVYLLEGDALMLRACSNPRLELGSRLNLSLVQDLTDCVAEHREAVAVGHHAYQDVRFKFFNELPADRFEAFLSVPMVSGGRLAGVIIVQNRAPYLFTPREISMTAMVGLMGGAEVERARLESENIQLSARLETRKTIERAKGILQREMKVDEETAYRTLQRESRVRRKPMKEIAEVVLLIENLKRRPA